VVVIGVTVIILIILIFGIVQNGGQTHMLG